jgi:hypothetical protein
VLVELVVAMQVQLVETNGSNSVFGGLTAIGGGGGGGAGWIKGTGNDGGWWRGYILIR